MSQSKISVLKCPDSQPNCETNPMKLQTSYAMTSSTTMVLNGVVGGLAVAIAIILSDPIKALVALIPGLTNPILIALVTIAIYFIFAVIIILVMIPVNRKLAKLKEIASYNGITM